MLIRFIKSLFETTLWALAIKEFNHIKRNKQLMFLLVFPPTIQLLLYGFILNPDVHNLKLGIVDYADISASREFISALTENHVFVAEKYFLNERLLNQDLEAGKLNAGVVIPANFARNLSQGKTVKLQFLIDGVNANTAGIANGYIKQIVNQYSLQNLSEYLPPLIHPEVIFLYNPGLISSWFFVPGIIGMVLTLISSITTAVTIVREKDTGTIEQLLMTPVADWEILLAKIAPLMVLLMGDVFLGLGLGYLIFGIPFRGSLPLFSALSCLYLLVCMSIGIILATICRNQQQVVLLSFFINLPIIQLSGVIAPIETMPVIFQHLSLLNPLRYYVAISRAVLLKGVGLDVLLPKAIALCVFAVILLTISIRRFRTQMS
jgi:ABC-2 type transport system permease protein